MTASAFADRLLGYPHNLIVTHDSQVITANVTNIRACYQKALAGGAADLRGKVIVHFEIAPDGTVKTARVKSTTLKHAGVESCVIGQVKD